MTNEEDLERMSGRSADRSSTVDTGLTLLGAAIAAVLVLPIGWLAIDAAGLGWTAVELAIESRTTAVLVRSIALVAVVTGASIVLGVALALLTVQGDLPFSRFWTILCALPLAVPSYLGAFAFVSAFGPNGALADLLAPVGISSLPSVYGFAGAAFVLTLYTYPYVFLTTRASLLSLDGTLVEAGQTLNSGRWEALKRVTIPQILPGIAAGSLLVALYTLADFGTPNIMRVEVFTQFIYAQYNAFARDYAAVLSLQLLGVTAVILAIESRIGADESGAYESGGNRGAVDLDLGAWQYPALLVPVAVFGLAILVPIGIFGMWLTQGGPGYEAGQVAFAWEYAWNSANLALLAAAASVVVALPIAMASARTDSRLAALADRASYVGYATPGIVLAIALLSFGLDLLPALADLTGVDVVGLFYKTIPMLVFAYVVRFMPQAIGSIRTSTLQVDRELVEAAQTLGRSRLSAFRSVTLPLILPGVAAGAALVFLTTMKELPATLMLRPLGFDTLVTYIWTVQEAGFYGQAAVPALILVVVSGLSMAVILSQETGDSS
ncbi:iron(III) transport system permease protein [Halorientalis persicus]|jgi:iron(III) transport system permease protein|uniref:Iron(III) transport system permease protein n=2 Tax=Halorientalis persicus TaxID=1367881 RepID=A0A1H8UN98_9EURY|nr:iron ABC transporter permease [Halorientalis persicus]SEP04679.1 iron(III) transport system permease protein [Halorientalis persicus]